jgi:hypothetical protein
MPPLRELNPSDATPQNETAAVMQQERMLELEVQNSQLRTLVVELLNKNEELRIKVARLEENL